MQEVKIQPPTRIMAGGFVVFEGVVVVIFCSFVLFLTFFTFGLGVK